MTNYNNITVAEKLYHRTDKEVTCIEFKLKDSLEKESFTKLLSNLKTAFKGSQVKVYYSKVIFEFDKDGNFVPDEKRKGFNKSHGGFLIETGSNFDKPACEKALVAIDKTIGKAIKDGVYKVKVVKSKTTKADMEKSMQEMAELIARLKNACDKNGIAY